MTSKGKQQRNLPTREKIAEYWCDDKRLNGRVVTDACWLCGIMSSRIQRCHIIPRNQGGSDTADNLHLLCSGCHARTEDMHGERYWSCFAMIQHDIIGRAIGSFILVLPMLIEQYDSLCDEQRQAVDEWQAGGTAVDLLKAKAVF